jgi:hypothetical protein
MVSGSGLDSSKIIAMVESWLRTTRVERENGRTVSTHVDDLGIAPETYAERVDACKIALRWLADVPLNAVTGIVWHVGDTTELIVNPPVSLPNWSKHDEPPSLYVVPRNLLSKYESVEEYRLSLDASSYGFLWPSVVSYYRCFRPIEFREKAWEYSRSLYFENREPHDRV